MGDVLQTNVVEFIQTLHKAISELSEKTGSMLKNIDGTGHAAEQRVNDDKFTERGESKTLTTQEKERYKEIFGIFNVTTKFSSEFKTFDKNTANFLTVAGKQSTDNQKTNTLIQKNLELFTKPTSKVIKQITPDDAAIKDIGKNISIIANIMNKQYIAEQKKFDTLKRDENIPSITPKTVPLSEKITSKVSSLKDTVLSFLGNTLKLLIGGLIGYWILKNPQKAIKILKDAWEFIKMLGGKLWDLAKFLWPIIEETGKALWEGIKFLAPYFLKAVKLFDKVIDMLGPKLTGAIAAILIGYKLFGGKITSLIFKMTRGIFKGIGSLTTYIGKKLFSKVATKAATKAAGKVATKAAGKVAAKTAGRSLLKKIPLVGAVAGLAFGAGRLFSGDWKGAAAEVASGVASTIPGVGTAVSLAVDAGLAARDINNETKEAAKMTKEAAGAAAGAAGAAEDAAESVEDAAGAVKDKAKQSNIPGKETSIPDFDNDISPAYKEITDKLIDGNKNQLSVSKLQLDQITTNGTKLDKIIECLKNPQLNNVTVNQKSSNNSTLQTNIVPQKSLTKAEYVDSLNLFGQNLREGVV